MSDTSAGERLGRLEKAVRLSLELLEAGRVDEAREELRRVASAAATPEVAISDGELEQAFARAEPETERMRSADHVAQEAIRQADGALAFGPDEVPQEFATSTMAELLESQGDRSAAAQIRAGLAAGTPRGGRPSGRRQVIATLERWLENLRGGG